MLVTGDFVTTGGMDRANYALADYLARRGHPVSLVAHRVASELAAYPNVAVHRVPKPFGSYLLGSWPLAWAGRRVARQALTAGGRAVANGGSCHTPDVNWVHYVHAAYRPDAATGRTARAKATVEQPLNRSAERAALLAARVVVCNSERTRQDVLRLGVKPERAATVYYGSDPERFRPPTEAERGELRRRFGWSDATPVAAFVGALGDRRKGLDTLYTAWAELCRSPEWDAVLVVVGRGAELPAWEARTASAGLADRIRFLGFRSDVPDLLRAADVLVSPTRYEAYGLGVHEAICCGLPAVVSADAGVAERYPADLADWLLPNPDDAANLAGKLLRWRERAGGAREQFQPLSEALRARSWDHMAEDFLAAIGDRPWPRSPHRNTSITPIIR